MKLLKSFIFLLLIAISSEMVVAQNYVIPTGRRYIMRRYNPFVYPLYGDQILSFDAIGDTVIDDNLYTFIYSDYYGESNFIRWDGTKCLRYMPETQRDTLMFDESWEVGDTMSIYREQIITEIGYIEGRKYWEGSSGIRWFQGVGQVSRPPFLLENYYNSHITELICCVEPTGDTLYVNRNILHLIQTGISSLTSDNLTLSPVAGGLSVSLGTATDWSATLYNSNGVTVAQQQGSGSEIFLSTDSKGTHILVVKAGGSVVKKKVLLR